MVSKRTKDTKIVSTSTFQGAPKEISQEGTNCIPLKISKLFLRDLKVLFDVYNGFPKLSQCLPEVLNYLDIKNC